MGAGERLEPSKHLFPRFAFVHLHFRNGTTQAYWAFEKPRCYAEDDLTEGGQPSLSQCPGATAAATRSAGKAMFASTNRPFGQQFRCHIPQIEIRTVGISHHLTVAVIRSDQTLPIQGQQLRDDPGNAGVNCLDRHVQTWRKNKAAIIWESEPGEIRTLTYKQLYSEVQKPKTKNLNPPKPFFTT